MSGKDFEIEEGREVVGRTIVGGRPLARRKRKIRIPIGIEKVLCKAAVDPVFRASLYEDRRQALAGLAGELAEAEADILLSVPSESLETMIAKIEPQKHTARRFMRGVMAATLAAASAVAVVDCVSCSAGVGPGTDDAPVEEVRAGEVVAPETMVQGSTADEVFVEPDVVMHEDLMAPGGIIPDAE